MLQATDRVPPAASAEETDLVIDHMLGIFLHRGECPINWEGRHRALEALKKKGQRSA